MKPGGLSWQLYVVHTCMLPAVPSASAPAGRHMPAAPSPHLAQRRRLLLVAEHNVHQPFLHTHTHIHTHARAADLSGSSVAAGGQQGWAGRSGTPYRLWRSSGGSPRPYTEGCSYYKAQTEPALLHLLRCCSPTSCATAAAGSPAAGYTGPPSSWPPPQRRQGPETPGPRGHVPPALLPQQHGRGTGNSPPHAAMPSRRRRGCLGCLPPTLTAASAPAAAAVGC